MARFLISILAESPSASFDTARGGRSDEVVLDRFIGPHRCVLERVASNRGQASNTNAIRSIAPDRYGFVEAGSDSDVVIEISGAELVVHVPVFATRQIYYSKDAGGMWITDDPRLLVRPGMSLDSRGIFCVLQLSGLVAPFSLWNGVRRLAPGKQLVIDAATLEFEEKVPPRREVGPVHPEDAPPVEEQEEILIRTLDAQLGQMKAGGRAVILYSGGVDSGLLAARAAVLGWDACLVHCSTRPSDTESIHARRMADHLGFEFHLVEYAPESAMPLLDEMFDSYGPVNDFSMLPTWFLARHVVDRFGEYSAAFDGTGADVAFSGSAKLREWQKLYAIPDVVRRTIGSTYDLLNLWMTPGRLEDVVRKLRRGVGWPLPHAAILSAPMGGIGFHVPREVEREVIEALDTWLDGVLRDESFEMRFATIRMALRTCVCACQKAYAMFDRSSIALQFPFLTPAMTELALRGVNRWVEPVEQPKSLLKRVLARNVPAEMVYRKKSGFSIPPVDTFGHPTFLARFDELLETQDHPFTEWLDHRVMLRIRRALGDRVGLAWYTYEFIWAAVFGFHWLCRAQERSATPTRMQLMPERSNDT